MLKIKLGPSFIILLFIGLYGGFFKELCLFITIIGLHELAHIFVAYIFKIHCQSFSLTIIGGCIELEYYNDKPLIIKILINSAGIMMNFFLIIIFLSIKLPEVDKNIIVGYNYLMIIVNLLPIPPLDGFKIIKDIFNHFFDIEYTNDCLFLISLIFLSILGIGIFIFKLYGYFIILGFLFFKTLRIKKETKLKLKYPPIFY